MSAARCLFCYRVSEAITYFSRLSVRRLQFLRSSIPGSLIIDIASISQSVTGFRGWGEFQVRVVPTGWLAYFALEVPCRNQGCIPIFW